MGICILHRCRQTVFLMEIYGKCVRVLAPNPRHHTQLNHDKISYRLPSDILLAMDTLTRSPFRSLARVAFLLSLSKSAISSIVPLLPQKQP